MSNTDKLVQTIKEWVKVDNEIRAIKKEDKLRKDAKKQLSIRLMEIMKHHELDCVDINDGKLIFNSHNVKKPLNKKHLLGILSKYYKGNTSRATELNDFILNNREEILKETIVRKIND